MPGGFVSVTLIIGGLFFIGAAIANIVVFNEATGIATDKTTPTKQTLTNMEYLNIVFAVIGFIMVVIGGFGLYSATHPKMIKKP